jgi:hypothetical protein
MKRTAWFLIVTRNEHGVIVNTTIEERSAYAQCLNVCEESFIILILQYNLNLSSLRCTVVSGRLGVSFLATVGVYSRLLYIPDSHLEIYPDCWFC